MWVPKALVEILGFAKEDLSALRAENTLLRHQLAVSQTNFDWLRIKVNQLEFENKALLEKAYNIKVPALEIVRQAPSMDPSWNPKNFDFNDMGEDIARKLGFPVYAENTNEN